MHGHLAQRMLITDRTLNLLNALYAVTLDLVLTPLGGGLQRMTGLVSLVLTPQ